MSQLAVGDLGATYTINFDDTVSGVNNGRFAGTGFEPEPAAGRLDSDAWALTGSLDDGNLNFGATALTGDYARLAPTAPQTSGGIYAFSGGSISGAALGIQPTADDFTPGTITLRIRNDTSSFISSFQLGYTVHVRNDQPRANSFNFSHSEDNFGFIAEPAANLTSGAEVAANTAFQANLRTVTLTGLAIPAGGFYYLRWSTDDSSGSGNRDEFALDDIRLSSFTAGAAPEILTWAPSTPVWDTAAANFNNGTTQKAFSNGDSVIFNEPGRAAQSTVQIDPAGVSPKNILVSNTTGTYSFSGGPITASGTLTKSNAGTLALNTTYTGPAIALTGGTLRLMQSDLISDTTAVRIAGGATLDLNGQSEQIGDLRLAGGTLATGAGTFTLTSDLATEASDTTSTITGSLNTSTSPRIISAADGAAAVDLHISAAISGGNGITGGALTLSGPGVIRLSANNSQFSSPINTNSSTKLSIAHFYALGPTLRFNGGSIEAAVPLTGANAVVTSVSIGGNVRLTGSDLEFKSEIGFFGNALKTITVENNTTFLAGFIEPGATTNTKLIKAGAGMLTLAGGPNFGTAGTEVLDGRLRVLNEGILNRGDVTVSGNLDRPAVLELALTNLSANPDKIDDLANVILNSSGANRGILALNFSSSFSETVNTLRVDGALLTPGIYNAGNLAGYITGTGNLLVTIPEPSSLATLLIGATSLLGVRLRRRR
jgi:hypothetical protein